MFTFLLSHNSQMILKYKVHWKRRYAYSAISRAILKPVYQFGIPTKLRPPTIKSVKTNSSAGGGVNILKCFILLTMRIVYNIACLALRARIYSKYKMMQKNRIIANVELRHETFFFLSPWIEFQWNTCRSFSMGSHAAVLHN